MANRVQSTSENRYFLPGKAPGSEVAFGAERGSGLYFLFFPNPDDVTVDEDRLSPTEIVALLKQYGKPSRDLQMAIDAFTMDIPLDRIGLPGGALRRASQLQTNEDEEACGEPMAEEAMMEKHDQALLPVEIARMRAAGLVAPEPREVTAASGLYGYPKQVQNDVEGTVRKARKQALKIAQEIYSKDARIARFLELHAKRANSTTAKLLVEAMKQLGPKFARKAKSERLAGGLYGLPTKTARLGLSACSDLRAYVGEIAFGLHMRRQARYENLTGFMQEHSKKARCAYTKMILGCYPEVDGRTAGELPEALKEHQFKSKDDKDEDKEDKKAGKLPEALKKHQFTSEDNPNPKGNDKDKDGKKNEKKPFEGKKKASEFDADEIGETVKGPLEMETDEPFMKGQFTQDENSELFEMEEKGQLGKGASGFPTSVQGWLEWQE